ncbi:SymE family type I addiction module toxin [Tenacibaculum sp. FZY0031]|uniref:SymE family type I addiction module toxin n=1 Tax=Tenacibaculum sp. FZY0031 TaxID=3116648 RepID=UPI002ECEDB95|nr:SymE family type I addiction module toxin [Tenacibaculum sp. FZY0031]
MSQFRKLKIYQKHQPREWRYITVPEIRLEGKWLKELGLKSEKKLKLNNKRIN